MDFEEIKIVLNKVLEHISTCDEPDRYVYEGKLTLKNFYDSIFLESIKYNIDEIGISKLDYQKISEFVKDDFSKENFDFIFYLSKDFNNFFPNFPKEDKHFFEIMNGKRNSKGLEPIVLN